MIKTQNNKNRFVKKSLVLYHVVMYRQFFWVFLFRKIILFLFSQMKHRLMNHTKTRKNIIRYWKKKNNRLTQAFKKSGNKK